MESASSEDHPFQDDPREMVDLAGEQPTASGSSRKRGRAGRPSLVDPHVHWDGSKGDRQPGACVHCKVHHYDHVRKDAVMQHLLHCKGLEEETAQILRQSLAAPVATAKPKRVKVASSSMSQSLGRGPMDGYVHRSFSTAQAVCLELALLRWFVVAKLPFRAVDSPFFKAFMDLLSPNRKYPRETCC